MKRRLFLASALLGLLCTPLLISEPPEAPGEAVRATDVPQADAARRHRTSRSAPVATDWQLRAAEAWIDDQVMVTPAHPEQLDQLAADYDAAVVRQPGAAGVGVLSVADADDLVALTEALREDDRVVRVERHARIIGAGKGGKGGGKSDDGGAGSATLLEYQWHHDLARAAETREDLSGVVVAVLDTGVAYESRKDKGVSHAQAASLAGSAIVAPYDFVNGDSLPLDDHQHGTHIASIIASDGDVVGIAPGVSLMPLKVLDETNSGYEIDLIEAIHHAVDSGADIINMSLSFGQGYVPSAAMVEAIDAARVADVVMIAAAGNEGLDRLSYPAASPAVFSVGALCPDSTGEPTVAGYTNRGLSLDLMAPGGCIDADLTGDGYPDGILAETISLNDPGTTGHWFMAGSSQAAAVVSGAAARLIAAQVSPADVPRHLRNGASADLGEDSVFQGLSLGSLDLQAAHDNATGSTALVYLTEGYSVAVLPWLADDGDGMVSPMAELSVVGRTGVPAEGVEILGTVHGGATGAFRCTSDASGRCSLSVAAVDLAQSPEATWRFAAEAVVSADGSLHRPGRLLFPSDELDALVETMQSTAGLEYAVLSVYWPAGEDPDWGAMAEGYAAVDSGTGIATSPMSLLLTRDAMHSLATVGEDELDGTGIATSPMRFKDVVIDDISLSSGTGISTSPMGTTRLKMASFDGSGIATSSFPLRSVYLSEAVSGSSGTVTYALSLSTPVLTQDDSLAMQLYSALSESSMIASPTADLIASGGFVSEDGYQGASLLTETGIVETPPVSVGSTGGTGASSM